MANRVSRVGRPCAILGAVETLGDHTEGQGMGQDLVVPGEVAHRQQVDAGVFLQLPVGGAQLAADAVQRVLIQIALPVGFEGFFSSRSRADARETKCVGQSHGEFLPGKTWRYCRQPTPT